MNKNSKVADYLRRDTPFFISTFYQFIKIEDPEITKQKLLKKAEELQILGLLILGHEGFNTTCSSQSEAALIQWKDFIKKELGLSQLNEKNSQSDTPPFLRFSIKIRDEIVTTGRKDLHLPTEKQNHNHHLSPEEWDRVMEEELDNVVIIDTRNWYEYEIGSFQGALNPNIEKFTEFPRYFEEQNISPDKKILIFCTGGIRCEKGILELQEKGYKNVFQLEGGILNYLEKRPNKKFWGECFVFDNRVAVTQELKPS
ncbi:MAG: rhodanese-like domain-containing protein, partial [Bdellovibrionales bacterium]